MTEKRNSTEAALPIWSWILSIALFIVLVVVVARHWGEAEQFVQLARQAEPLWLFVALLLQIGTYASEACVWRLSITQQKKHLPIQTLIRLAVEKLSVNQLVPTGGVAGNAFIVRTLRRRNIPASAALEAMIVDMFTRYAAFAIVTVAAVVFLWINDDISPVIVSLLSAFSVVIIGAMVAVWWLVHHRLWKPPRIIARWKMAERLLQVIKDISPDRVLSLKFLTSCTLFQIAIFAFDSSTLWVMTQALGMDIHPLFAFVALVMGTIAATISFLPGGLGSFEAACTAILHIMGVPLEAALTSTLLLRFFTFWLPLIPGALLIRDDMNRR